MFIKRHKGVKAKMCETTPYVNSVGTQYIAARAKIELTCDSIREQGPALHTCIGLADGTIHPASDCDNHIAKSLLNDVSNTRSTMVMRITSFPIDLFSKLAHIIKFYFLANLIVHDVTNGDQHKQRWQQKSEDTNQMSLSSALYDAKYYHYDPVEILKLVDFNANVANLLEPRRGQHRDTGKCKNR